MPRLATPKGPRLPQEGRLTILGLGCYGKQTHHQTNSCTTITGSWSFLELKWDTSCRTVPGSEACFTTLSHLGLILIIALAYPVPGLLQLFFLLHSHLLLLLFLPPFTNAVLLSSRSSPVSLLHLWFGAFARSAFAFIRIDHLNTEHLPSAYVLGIYPTRPPVLLHAILNIAKDSGVQRHYPRLCGSVSPPIGKET